MDRNDGQDAGEPLATGFERHAHSRRRLSDYPALVRALLAVKRAAARANRDAGKITDQTALAIEERCLELESCLAEGRAEAFAVDPYAGGGGVPIHLAVLDAIGVPGTNASQSTTDVVGTAMRLAILEEWERLEMVLHHTGTLLDGKAEDFRQVMTLARTALRDAMAAPLGILFEGYAQRIQRHRETLAALAQAFTQISMGATIIGTGVRASAEYRDKVLINLEKLLDRPLKRRASLPDAVQNIDDLGRFAGELALLARAAIKLGGDLRLLFSGPRGGFGEIALPRAIIGSTFFPGKENPTVPESLIQGAFLALDALSGVERAMEFGELYLNVYAPYAGLRLLDAVTGLERAFLIFNEHCLRDLDANRARCAELAALGETQPAGEDGTFT